MNSVHIQNKLKSLFSNHDHIFLNRYIFGDDWESDFFSVTNSDYCYEVEIKISKSDFKADFEKFKHKIFENHKNGYMVKPGTKWRPGNYGEKWERGEHSSVAFIELEKATIPNKFFFACPEGLLTPEEIPKYAGLIYVSQFEAKVVKQAPFLHKRNLDIKGLLFSKYQYGYINAMAEVYGLKQKYDSLSSKFNNLCRGLEKEHELLEGSVTSMSAFKQLLKDKKRSI